MAPVQADTALSGNSELAYYLGDGGAVQLACRLNVAVRWEHSLRLHPRVMQRGLNVLVADI